MRENEQKESSSAVQNGDGGSGGNVHGRCGQRLEKAAGTHVGSQ